MENIKINIGKNLLKNYFNKESKIMKFHIIENVILFEKFTLFTTYSYFENKLFSIEKEYYKNENKYCYSSEKINLIKKVIKDFN